MGTYRAPTADVDDYAATRTRLDDMIVHVSGPVMMSAAQEELEEERLREQVAIEAEDFVWRREQARAEQARREAARAAAEERAERERQAAAAADAVRQALPCEDCGRDRSAGLCEACGCRRETETLIVEAGFVAAAWSADLDDADDVAAVAAEVRTAVEREIAVAWAEFLKITDQADLETDRAGAELACAFSALQAAQLAAPEYERCALAMLGRAPEADAEAERAYATECGRRWYRANPNGADAVAAAECAAHAARARTAEHLLALRLEQLRDQAAEANTEQGRAAPWSERLAELATRPINGETTEGARSCDHRLSGVDVAHKEKPKRRTGQDVQGDGREPIGLGGAIREGYWPASGVVVREPNAVSSGRDPEAG